MDRHSKSTMMPAGREPDAILRATCPRGLTRVAIACLLAAGCAQKSAQPPVRQPPVVTVSKPVEIDFVETLYFEGYTAAVAELDVRARVSGYLSKIYFKDGEDVKEGDPLFLIDPRPYQATLDQAKAELARVEAQLKRLDSELARAEKLLPKRTISQEEYDRTAADRAASAADLKSRQAAIEQANLNLHFAAIRSPINGRISRRLVTEGNLVAANETLLTTIVSVAPIYAYFDVDEPTVLKVQQMIREGKIRSARETEVKVQLALDIDSGYPYEGVIDFVENRIDPKTGTLKIRAVFPNKDNALSPGLHARIKLPLGQPQKALAVSERAIGSTQGQKFVYVVDDKNQVVERRVSVGPLEDKLRVITAGLKGDERVIVNGLQRVREGITVEPKVLDSTASSPAPPERQAADSQAARGEAPAPRN
jgi:RND family efflux transporter MFP subunit